MDSTFKVGLVSTMLIFPLAQITLILLIKSLLECIGLYFPIYSKQFNTGKLVF